MLAGSLLSFNMQILMTFESPMLEVYLPNLVCKEFSFSRCFLESSDNMHTFWSTVHTFPKSLSTSARHLAPGCLSCPSEAHSLLSPPQIAPLPNTTQSVFSPPAPLNTISVLIWAWRRTITKKHPITATWEATLKGTIPSFLSLPSFSGVPCVISWHWEKHLVLSHHPKLP